MLPLRVLSVLTSRVTWIVVAVLAVAAAGAYWLHRHDQAVAERARIQAVTSAQAAERARKAVLTTQDSLRAARAVIDAQKASLAAAAADGTYQRVRAPIARRLERDSSPMQADTVRALILAADSLRLADSTALAAKDTALAARETQVAGLRGRVTLLTGQVDSLTSKVLTGHWERPKRWGATVGPSVGVGACASRPGATAPCAYVGVSLTWGRRLGDR